ncbi:uncharacterized protein LOC143013479 [Genypterus blacodes]|uniref:uncharacterized protein LOC143013479 n=1 Tax=Genypterus blacodes TaxID=154954 RepID=UPI003F764301
MAETNAKYKLKKKKRSMEELNTETPQKSLTTRCHSDGSGVSAVSWWSREDLPAFDCLWALTLRSALPYLQSQHWSLVPDLPHPSSAKPTSQTIDEQHWCDLIKEVTPLPESSTRFPRPSPSPDLSLSSTHQELPVRTKPLPNSPNSNQQVLSRYGGLSHKSKSTSSQSLTKRLPHNTSEKQASLHSWAVRGPPSLRKKEEKGQEQEEKLKRQSLTTHRNVSDSWVPLQWEGKKTVDRREADNCGKRREELQTCPMCLIVFPVGFTQMDRDGHLAQCLSEMNADMTW